MEIDIGTIENYYGGLAVRENAGRYEWSIENWNGHSWKEIPKTLYDALIQFEDERVKEATDDK
jgi:hypothetical protein